MNLYFLVEGRRTEKKVYREWIRIPFPHLTEVQAIDEVLVDHYFVFAGMGYPHYKKRIADALNDISRHGHIDHFFICVDAEGFAVEAKTKEIQEILSINPPFTNTHVIVHNCCIETWFLGNPRLLPVNPQGSELRNMKRFYNVATDDPEEMGHPNDYSTRAQFHFDYLRLSFQEHGLSYTKIHPRTVVERHYFDALVKRTADTGHMATFQKLITVWRRLGGSI